MSHCAAGYARDYATLPGSVADYVALPESMGCLEFAGSARDKRGIMSHCPGVRAGLCHIAGKCGRLCRIGRGQVGAAGGLCHIARGYARDYVTLPGSVADYVALPRVSGGLYSIAHLFYNNRSK